jgi:hypothetical protein
MSDESELDARAAKVSGFLAKKDKASALATCLQNPPVNDKSEKSEELKVAFHSFIFSCFLQLLHAVLVLFLGEKCCDS